VRFFHKSEISKNIKSDAKLYIIVYASLNKACEFFIEKKVKCIVIDECHKAMCKTYQKFLKNIEESGNDFQLIGFTATPERLDRKPLLSLFEKITYSKSIYELIKNGYLCDIKAFQIKTKIKIESLGKSGDFKPNEISKLDCYSRNSLLYRTYFENCLGKKTLIF